MLLDDHPHAILVAPSLVLVAVFLFTALASGETFILILAAIATLSALWHGWRRRRSRFLLTTTHFAVSLARGVNQHDERTYPWNGLHKAEYHLGMLGRLFGYGTLLLRTDRSLPPLRLAYVPKVQTFARAINEQLRADATRRVNELRDSLSEVGAMVQIDAREFEKLMEESDPPSQL